MNHRQLEKARKLLCRMQADILGALLTSRRREAGKFARVAAVTAADTIYYVDKVSEEAIFAWFEAHWPRSWPVELVMEGLEDNAVPTVFPRGTPVKRTIFKCILDPIDGTRNFMTDKRSAWILTGLAPQKGPKTEVRDIVVAAMTELPTTKQWRSDQLSAVRGGRLISSGLDVRTGKRAALALRPSRATDYSNGFASFVRFFPEGKALLAQAEEDLWEELHILGKGASPVVFDDQYISTGGQIYELIAGHDRMLADLRPLAHARLGLANELVCHPYDICTALLLETAGGLVEAPDGKPLRIPLDTTHPVAWVGYANPKLAALTRPALKKICKRRLGFGAEA